MGLRRAMEGLGFRVTFPDAQLDKQPRISTIAAVA